MLRTFSHAGHDFHMMVVLNTTVEPSGAEHTLAVSCGGAANYTATYSFTDATAEQVLDHAETACRTWVANRANTTAIETTLARRGFSA